MDVEKFLATVEKKGGKRSRLEPFISDIMKLREENCSLNQVREYLQLNDIEISVAGLSAYIQRRIISSSKSNTQKQNANKNVSEIADEKNDTDEISLKNALTKDGNLNQNLINELRKATERSNKK